MILVISVSERVVELDIIDVAVAISIEHSHQCIELAAKDLTVMRHCVAAVASVLGQFWPKARLPLQFGCVQHQRKRTTKV